MPDIPSPPLHQSLWFPVAPESGEKSSQDEPEPAPAPLPSPPPVVGLGWKAPRRVHVPVFERDAAVENTRAAADTEINPAADRADRDYSRRSPMNDETVRQLREHIVPPQSVEDDEAALDELEQRCAAASRASSRAGSTLSDSDDPDFQEVARAPSPIGPCRASFQEVVHFGPPVPDNPPKGAEAACAPIAPCGRDDATPNDGGVPQGVEITRETICEHFRVPESLAVNVDGGGQDDQFCCALWSDGTFSIRPSDGEPLVLNRRDSRALILYVSETLSDRVRIEG